MLSQNLLLLKCLSCLLMFHFLQICIGKKVLCGPSSCGNIPNISYPFRLQNDPKGCGDLDYELACENNTTLKYFNSHKYIVQAINYSNYTIRLTELAIGNDSCSFPKYSLSRDYFRNGNTYTTRSMDDERDISWSVTFMSCPYPVSNSLLLEADTHCAHWSYGLNESIHTYIKFGHLNGSYVMNMCRIHLVVMTSLPLEDEQSVSLSDIHSSLLYGFELSWFSVLCGRKCNNCWFDGKRARCVNLYWVVFGGGPPGLPVWLAQAIVWITFILRLTIGVVVLNVALRIFLGMPLMFALLIYKLRRRHFSTFDMIETFLRSNNLMPIQYSNSDIKKMTRAFREKLGEGGYGSVYKGKLRSGHSVAVKVLSKPKSNGQDFINEIATIGRIHHVNVVKLVGYCAERSKRALIYDFMPNGSLDKYIHSQEITPISLSWEKKYEIAVGVAHGIEYLHRGCDIQILHFDIKPHNILLDDNFTPKISDFGLAKFYSTEKTTVTLTAARGTIGYVAPELINRSIGGVSYKADVYSFGMLLMEMVGLKRDIVVDEDAESSQYFPYWIYDRFNKGKDIEFGHADDGNDCNDGNVKITRIMTIVGLWCIQMSPDDRPPMSQVVKMLESRNGNLQVPTRPSESTVQMASYSDGSWGMSEQTGSMALQMGDDGSSDIYKGGD